jgi:hypothetical protein
MNDEKAQLPGKSYEYKTDYANDLEVHDNQTSEWDANEAMLISKTYDQVSKQTKSGITDSEAATMIIERSARVVGQLPSGETEAAGKRDIGKGLFMDVLRQKWWYPNANAQRPFLDKIRLWEMYSGVYGTMPMFYDWDVSPSGYIGPNCWLWNPRNFIPQQGRYTISDMDYAHAISYMGHKEISDLITQLESDPEFAANSGWDLENLKTVQETAKSASTSPDNHRDSFVVRTRSPEGVKGRVEVVTRFEAGKEGRWISFSPQYGCLELRNTPNPHKNAKIPFINKSAIPLFDSYYGLSDMSRAKPIQFAKDGLTNFYFQGIKMNIYPPTVVNAQGILKHTVSNEPGAIWEEIIPNSARRLETSTAGLNTYQAAMGMLNGSIQNVFGTTTTQSNADTAMSPAFGKTPEALRLQQNRESSRDNQNRAYLQSAIEQLMDAFAELTVNMGTEDIAIDLFADDIEAIQKMGYDDITELLLPNESLQSGRLVLNPKKLQGVSYRFNMKPDSTVKMTKQEQKTNLLEFVGVLSQHQNELQAIHEASGKHINWEQIINTYAEVADLPGVKDVFVQGEVPAKEETNPLVTLLEVLKIQFEDLPEDAKQQILGMISIQSQELSPKQQEIDIKKAQAAAQVLSATQQPEPAAPESINGKIYKDPNISAVAKEFHGMKG